VDSTIEFARTACFDMIEIGKSGQRTPLPQRVHATPAKKSTFQPAISRVICG
jgi:hypothetical protein